MRNSTGSIAVTSDIVNRATVDYTDPMRTKLERWRHRIQGRSSLFQFYATVHATTCEDCLARHGQIFESSEATPDLPLHEGCRCELLEFPVSELGHFRSQGVAMKAKAGRELERRRLMAALAHALERGDSTEDVLQWAAQALAIEVYLPEIETFCHAHRERLQAAPELTRELRDRFLKAYRYKYQDDRYAAMPERMKAERTDHGLATIRDLFDEHLPDDA